MEKGELAAALEPAQAPAASARRAGIWPFAFGYFGCYVPYAALTKVLSDGLAPSLGAISGAVLLPWSAIASAAAMIVVLTALRWWRFAGHRQVGRFSVPSPSRWTLVSGLASALVIVTTTLAYTFRGASIVLMVLLMKGGVLVIAPIVDRAARRHVRQASWAALFLSLLALAIGFPRDFALGAPAAFDLVVYLLAYLVRLRAMTALGKSEDREAQLRYFVEEHMVAAPALVSLLATMAALDVSGLRDGFALVADPRALAAAALVGLLSEGTGVFGALVLLDARENTFSVPVNRASSVLAGVVAGLALSVGFGAPGVPGRELLGAAVLALAMAALAFPREEATGPSGG